MTSIKSRFFLTAAAIGGALGMAFAPAPADAAISCNRTLTADIVAFDMPLMWNRLGPQNINGMMFALRRDVVDSTTLMPIGPEGGSPGNVTLRPDKRPRPLVLRMGAGDCLKYKVTNLLDLNPNPFPVGMLPDPNPPVGVPPQPLVGAERSGIPFTLNIDDQVADRDISLRFQGTELLEDILDDGSNVGENMNSLIPVGGNKIFRIYAPEENTYVGTSYGATVGGEGLGGNTANGLWAVLNVGPKYSAFYRSQVTREEMDEATTGFTANGQPIIDYETTYPGGPPWSDEGKAGLPIINMVAPTGALGGDGEIVHSDINAIVAYGGADFVLDGMNETLGHFPATTYPLENAGKRNPTVPNRLEPFREFTIAFHDEVTTRQAYPLWYEDPVLGHTLHSVRDSFMINYGSGGIGTEIISSRLRVGPMHDCVNCAYEEFFLTAFTVADVGQLVDIPANFGLEACPPEVVDLNTGAPLDECALTGPKANFALFPDDPSNVHHSYTGDFTKFRNIHAGPGEQHIFHLHNHQWLFNANDDNSNYLDAQGIGPGSGYTYEINFGGSGNRNKTAGDAIFHCHFYPHFAQGMWEMWRIYDTFQQGTELQATVDGGGVHTSFVADPDGLGIGNGTPADLDGDGDIDARALPDPEIIVGTPIPGVVPLPGKAMAPMPAEGVTVVANDNEVCINNTGVGPRLLFQDGGVCPDVDAMGQPVPPTTGTATDPRPTGSLAYVPRVEDPEFGLQNPGYPFWIAGMEHSVGQRPPTPPLDMITKTQAEALTASEVVFAGMDGIADTIAAGDDIQVITPGTTGLDPDTVVVRPGPDLELEVAAIDPNDNVGDDPLWQHPGFADPGAVHGWDGGLPRFAADGYSAGSEAIVSVLQPRLDLSKEFTKIKPFFFPEEGTDLEQAAMAFHAQRNHPSFLSDELGTSPGDFVLNGQLPVPGAPYNEPCVDDEGDLLDGTVGNFFSGENLTAMSVLGASPFNAVTPRVYKAANVQFDAVFNKLGYHYPQQRIITLWQDVVPTIDKTRPPEPFVMRMNTFDCTQYVHSNVVPKAFELDDYQVRTPTDIIGQHIHLPKWDLTTADGAANGWNYEDGTLSPGMVVEVIHAINNWSTSTGNPIPATYEGTTKAVTNSAGWEVGQQICQAFDDFGEPVIVDGEPVIGADVCLNPANNPVTVKAAGELVELDHPFFAGKEPAGADWSGARSTMQRWFADPVVNVQGIDRGLGIIFTHDHYGPSTHQQIGLYSTLLIEPAASKWVHNETGEPLYTRTGSNPEDDGGPTSWQVAILTDAENRIPAYTENVGADEVENHREFYFEYSDFQHAYQFDVYVGADEFGVPRDEYHFADSMIDIGGPGQTANALLLGDQGLLAPNPDAFRDAIMPSFRQQAELKDGGGTGGTFPTDIWRFPPFCPGDMQAGGVDNVPRPCPEAI
ncbi:MAG: hypothetical protein ACYSVY_14610, partial [Planctomycetota bacterium]